MPLFKAVCKWAADVPATTFQARDFLQITPHFFSSSGSPGYSALANDLMTLLATSGSSSAWHQTDSEVHVALYQQELTGGKTGPPVFQTSKNLGTIATSNAPREVALCLSYYGQQNQPGYRGRLYWPVGLRPAGEAVGARPTTTQMDNVVAMGDALAAAGGAEWGWVVFSRKRQNFIGVTHIWCDDEWDTQRSRGLDPTTRQQKNVTG